MNDSSNYSKFLHKNETEILNKSNILKLFFKLIVKKYYDITKRTRPSSSIEYLILNRSETFELLLGLNEIFDDKIVRNKMYF